MTVTAETNGTFWNVTRDEYDADETCVRSSSLKLFMENRPLYYAQEVARTEPRREPSPNMQFGTALHEWLLEGKQSWIVWSEGSRATKAWKEFKAANAGKVILDAEDHNTILRMTEVVKSRPLAWELLGADGFPEHAAKWQHESGVWCKCLWDRLLFDGTIPDLKTVADPDRDFFYRQVRDYGYDISATFYLMGRAAVMPEVQAPFKWVSACTKFPHRVLVHDIDHLDVMAAKQRIDAALWALAKCRETGDWSDPEEQEVLTVRIPGHYYGR